MTKEDLEIALKELETQREILIKALNELNNNESGSLDFKVEEMKEFDIKKIMYNAIASGRLKNVLDSVSDGMDLTKTTLKSFSDIIDKTRDKMEGNIDEVLGPTGMPIMTDMWLPMLLTLLQTQEFQHLMANMIAQLFKINIPSV